MRTVDTDVAIIGAGGAGLRAAIARAEAAPKLRIALISKVYPMRSHTCAAEGGAAGVIKPDDSLAFHFDDTVHGGDWLSDQDAVECACVSINGANRLGSNSLTELLVFGRRAALIVYAGALAATGAALLYLLRI